MAAAPVLPGILQTLGPVLDRYGYLAVGGFVFLEDFGVPVPGETILVAAAVYAGTGHLSIAWVAIIATMAAILGDNVGFAIGRFGGRAVILRFGRYVFVTAERLDLAEQWFGRHGGKVVTVARFVEGLRQLNGIAAGVTRMRWTRFIRFNAIGAALWVGVWTTIGVVSGRHIDEVYRAAGRASIYVAGAVGLLLTALAVRHLRRRGRIPTAKVANKADSRGRRGPASSARNNGSALSPTEVPKLTSPDCQRSVRPRRWRRKRSTRTR
jgi:membrane protein DedA with SNARE-associated domain